MIEGIHWLGHASFRIDGEAIVYIDPYKLSGGVPADIICVSHGHYDHCSPTAIERVRTKDTVIITSPQCAGKFRGDVRPLEPGQAVTVREVVVEGVAAYNRGKPFHPPSGGGLGFVITTGGRRIYFAGDTDLIPEMATVRADVALLPVSGTYVMSAEDAAEAVRRIRPAVTVPMHYGTIVGTRGDAIRFKELACRPVAILEKES